MTISETTPTEGRWLHYLKRPEYGQSHLIEHADEDPEGLRRLLKQLDTLDKAYPGGLSNYIERARKLLQRSRDGANPYEGVVPRIPAGETLITGTPEYCAFEAIGLQHIGHLGFVLVAGGLGERLGYPDIKVGLPIETFTMMTYLEYYIQMIISCENYVEKHTGIRPRLPLAIMTSEDTHSKTLKLLRDNNCFGLPEDQITTMQQEKVPALIDNEARFATNSNDRWEITTKPHGHGDIHTLMHERKIGDTWLSEGIEWMLVFQDTNGLVAHAIAPMLGVSVKNDFAMNSLAIPRKPGEPVGAICRLEKSEADPLTVNVEYNQLTPMLKALGQEGDVADPATGLSPFPGNANVLIFKLAPYVAALQRTGGAIPEFVNPKYKDDSRIGFRSPTRLECLMQEFPRLLSKDDKVGVSQLDRWLSFSTVKNNVADAAAKSQSGGSPESPFTGESDFYHANAKLLELAAKLRGCDVEIAAPTPCSFLGVDYRLGPQIVMHPTFAICLDQVKDHIRRGKISLALRSTLILSGDVTIEGLQLDGALSLEAIPGRRLKVKNVSVVNKGWEIQATDDSDEPTSVTIRGYRFVKHEMAELAAV